MGLRTMMDQKRRYRLYRERVAGLPDAHRSAAEALEHYLVYVGPSGEAASLQAMLDDLADLFEQSVADGTSVRSVVGEDPVAFSEDFLRNYPGASWLEKERRRLTDAIDRAAGTTGDPS